MKPAFLACILYPAVLFLSCTACSLPFGGETPPQEVSILSWNVQNLFDDVTDGGEYDEFNPAKGEWNTSLFRIRINRVKEVLSSLSGGYPDIVLFQEMENENTLNVLSAEVLKNHYPWHILLEESDMSIHTAVLSRYPVVSIGKLETGYAGRVRLRPVTEIHFDLKGRELIVFNNHWKSRSEGLAATEDGRIAAAEVLTARIKKLIAADPGALILAAGDFNENHDEYKKIGRAYRTALIPSIETVPDEWTGSLYTCSKGSASKVEDGRLILYSPWYDVNIAGSYGYNSRWEKIDHFFLWNSFFDGSGYEYSSFEVVKRDFMLNDYGFPSRWFSYSEEGYSDHLPVLLRIADNDI